MWKKHEKRWKKNYEKSTAFLRSPFDIKIGTVLLHILKKNSFRQFFVFRSQYFFIRPRKNFVGFGFGGSCLVEFGWDTQRENLRDFIKFHGFHRKKSKKWAISAVRRSWMEFLDIFVCRIWCSFDSWYFGNVLSTFGIRRLEKSSFSQKMERFSEWKYLLTQDPTVVCLPQRWLESGNS